MACGLRPADEKPVLCGVWGEPGAEGAAGTEAGPSEAQDQGAWVWVTGRNSEDHAGPVAGTRSLGSQWRTWEMSSSDYFTFLKVTLAVGKRSLGARQEQRQCPLLLQQARESGEWFGLGW